jgi:hypothetical protein
MKMKLAKNGNAAGPATRPHSYVISCSARSPRGGGMTASARQRLRSHEQQVPHLPKRVAHSQSRDHELASLRWPAVRPALCSEEPQAGGGRRPQCPGNQSRLRAFSGMSPGDSPSRITRLPLALPQSFGKLRKLHVSLNPLSVTLLCLATQKTQPLVQKLWTLRLPCGRPRKTKNYSSASIPFARPFNNLHTVKKSRMQERPRGTPQVGTPQRDAVCGDAPCKNGSCGDGRLGRPAMAKPSHELHDRLRPNSRRRYLPPLFPGTTFPRSRERIKNFAAASIRPIGASLSSERTVGVKYSPTPNVKRVAAGHTSISARTTAPSVAPSPHTVILRRRRLAPEDLCTLRPRRDSRQLHRSFGP